MSDVLRRLVTFTVIACLLAYAVLLVAGAAAEADSQQTQRAVWVRDVVSPNIHRMSGVVMVPTTCSELRLKSEKISDTAYRLRFTTWELQDVLCFKERSPRIFHTVIFAPAVGVEFIATLDDKPLPIIVAPITDTH